MKRRFGPVRAVIVLVKALLIAWALMYLGEYFGWRMNEAEGGVVSALGLSGHDNQPTAIPFNRGNGR